MYPNIKTNRKEGERSCKIVNNIEIYICLLTEPSPQPRDLTFILMFHIGHTCTGTIQRDTVFRHWAFLHNATTTYCRLHHCLFPYSLTCLTALPTCPCISPTFSQSVFYVLTSLCACCLILTLSSLFSRLKVLPTQ